MRYTALLSLVLVSLLPRPAAAQTITAPSGGAISVKAADDYATRVFQDPWDMNERTDVGWWLFGSDAPASNFANPTFSGGVFSGTTTGFGARLFLLESGLPETSSDLQPPIGKTGKNFPIDASTYTHLVYRMSSPTGFQDTGNAANASQFIWSAKTIWDGQTVGASKEVVKGWAIYDVDLRTLPHSAVSGTNTAWGGTIRALQFLPNQAANSLLQIDWIRLVKDDPALYKTITWTGSAAVDLYLDNNNTASDGTLGRIALNKTGGSLSFFVGALEEGDYYVAVRPHSNDETTSGLSYSSGYYHVNGIPRLVFTSPSPEGSADDFATAKLGNPWDFTALSDIDYKYNVQNDGITSLNLTSEAGASLGAQTVYFGYNTPATAASGNVGDPFLFPLFWDYRGKSARIDPNRYRILTIDMGLPDLARSLPGGSIGRVVWKGVNDGLQQTVSKAWVVNHKAGENVLSHVTVDLNAMPIEPGSQGQTKWNSAGADAGIDAFRFDPHEFSNPTAFFIKRIRLAALDRTSGNKYTFRWSYSKSSGTVDLYRDSSGTRTFNSSTSVRFAQGVSAAAKAYTWDATGVPDGEYQIYAVFTDGTNSNQVYAGTPIVVDANSVALPAIVLSHEALNFSIYGGTRTSPQTVRLSFSGSGSQCWTATSNHGGVTVSPTSGTGAATLTIAAPGGFGIGETPTSVTIASCGSLSNSRNIAVTVRALASSVAPSGSLDTPTEGQAVSGSVAITGWAVDDVGVSTVAICRDAVAGEAPTAQPYCGGSARIFVGTATFIEGARPDVESAASGSPLNYRAGWGYLMLSNFLPNQGNGAFRIYAYAFDLDGRSTLIGSRGFNAQNSASAKPFGAIDTPAQGQVVCGSSFVNFGWALTRQPNIVATNGSTITVYIDGVAVRKPGALAARSDIQSLFPGYRNTSNAVGAFVFDTTKYANGLHSIYWLVTDSAGNSDGVGSRYFTVANPCSGT